MNNLEKKMVEVLTDLRENHHITGVKAEFETEGTRLEEALRLKEIVTKANLDLTIKIGGCEAIKDMHEARAIGVKAIIAPMIETPYAMEKYINAVKFVFPKEEQEDMDFLINVETITGFENLNKIISSPCFNDLSGVVLGRVDMTGSMGLTREDTNSDEIFKIATSMASSVETAKKDFIVGGEVSSRSLDFFRRLPYISRFETRKIIFDAKEAIKDKNAVTGIMKAVGFELMWLKNKHDIYGVIYQEDDYRVQMLEKRYKKLVEEVSGICV